MESFFGNTSVGAFLGSFTAFIFGIVAYDYTKKREKWVIHHNALVKTERLINRHLNQISSNIFLLEGSIETFSKSAFSENELSPLESPDYMTDYHNLELINVYQNYEALLEKVNHDMSGWNKSNNRLFDVALSGKVPPQDIEINRQGLSKRSKELINHLKDVMDSAYETGAYVRKFMKIDKRDFFARLKPTEDIKITKRQIKAEKKKFIKESKETMEKDRKGRLNKYNKDKI